MLNKITISPRLTEKTYDLLTKNIYTFNVPLNATKAQIAAEVEDQFEVTVLNVTILKHKGKSKKFSRGKRNYPGTTYQADTKKAFVRLAEGDKIAIFDQEVAAPAEAKEEEAK